MKTLSALAVSVLLTGCFSTSLRQVSRWTVDYTGSQTAGGSPVYGPIRLLQLSVAAPYDTRSLVVLREDGTVAFDPFNEFAAQPAQLLKTAAQRALAGSGLGAAVVPAVSSVRTDCAVEIDITRLALDCRQAGRRTAEVGVLVRLVKSNAIVGQKEARVAVDAGSGDYGAAFSEAASKAMGEAFAGLR